MNVNNNLRLQEFIDIVGTGHKVLDGDLRIKGGVLQKVNYGSPARRFFDLFFTDARTKSTPEENKAVRVSLYNAVKEWTEQQPNEAGANQQAADDKLKRLRSELGINNEDEPTCESQVALSRLTTKHIIQKYTNVRFDGPTEEPLDSAGKDNINYYITKQTDKNGKQIVTARRFGGVNGLLLTKDQFTKLFSRALTQAVESHKDEGPALKNLVNYYIELFSDETASAEDFSIFFGDDQKFSIAQDNSQYAKSHLDLSLDAVAEKLWHVLQRQHPLPTLEGKDRTVTEAKILPESFMQKVKDFSDRVRLVGEIGDLISFEGADEVNGNAGNDADTTLKKVRAMVADFFFTEEDLTEMERCGFGDGERIGRVLFRHFDIFREICLDFERSRRANQSDLQPESAAALAFKAFAQIDANLAMAFSKMIRNINSKLRFDTTDKGRTISLTLTECYNKAQDIFTEIGKVSAGGFEAAVDKAIERFFAKSETGNGVYDQICADLNLPDSNADTDDSKFLKLVLESALAVKASKPGVSNHHLALRRMLSAGTRFSQTTLGDGGKFDCGAMLRGAGPSLLKRLQSYNKNDYSSEQLAPNVESALNVITHSLQGMGDKLIKAQLYGVLMKLRQDDPSVERISVTKSNLGAASIAQTLLCKIHYKKEAGQEARPPVEVVIKLPRADVKMAFEEERAGFENVKLPQNPNVGENEGQQEDQTDRSLMASIRNFINSVEPEFDFGNETVNAMLAMIENESLGDGLIHSQSRMYEDMNLYMSDEELNQDVVARVGCSFDTDRKYGTEQLLLKPVFGKSDEELLRDVKEKVTDLFNIYKIKGDYVDGDRTVKIKSHVEFLEELKNIASTYFMGVSSGVVIMKKAEGTPIDGFIEELARKNNLVDADVERLIQAKKAMLQLGEELFNGLAYGNPPIYHGDLHGGNILYNPADGKYTLIDYGKGFPLNENEKEAILSWFQVVSKPHSEDETVLKDRTNAILEAYNKSIAEEIAMLEARQAAAGGDLVLERSINESLQFLRKSQDAVNRLLNPEQYGEPGDEAKDLWKRIKDALQAKVSMGGILEQIMAAFRVYEFAVPDTLFGFFGSFAKLSKTLEKLDDLIGKAHHEAPVNLLDCDLSFGPTEDNFALIVNKNGEDFSFKSDDEIMSLLQNKNKTKKDVLADFYSSIPVFIREKADEEAREAMNSRSESEINGLKLKLSALQGEDDLDMNQFKAGTQTFKWEYLFKNAGDDKVNETIAQKYVLSKNCYDFLNSINELGNNTFALRKNEKQLEQIDVDNPHSESLPELTKNLFTEIEKVKGEIGEVTQDAVNKILAGEKSGVSNMPTEVENAIKAFSLGGYVAYDNNNNNILGDLLAKFITNETKRQKTIALKQAIEAKTDLQKKNTTLENNSYKTELNPSAFTAAEAKELFDLEGRCLKAFKAIKDQKKEINENFAQLGGLFTACLSDYNKKKSAKESKVNKGQGA